MMKGEFGYCPRVLCEKQPVLPWGETDKPGLCYTRVYCPRCKGLFNPDYPKH
jgi:casein kinase II subunit beta